MKKKYTYRAIWRAERKRRRTQARKKSNVPSSDDEKKKLRTLPRLMLSFTRMEETTWRSGKPQWSHKTRDDGSHDEQHHYPCDGIRWHSRTSEAQFVGNSGNGADNLSRLHAQTQTHTSPLSNASHAPENIQHERVSHTITLPSGNPKGPKSAPNR